MTDELDRLRAENAELKADVERIKTIADNYYALTVESKAREVQLREAFRDYKWNKDEWGFIRSVTEALAIPQDTTALSALIAKAGEVMRERCADGCSDSLIEHITFAEHFAIKNCAKAIRAPPGVTLEDIK